MRTQITETQPGDIQRTYLIEGPAYATVLEFWSWLKETEAIEDYKIWLADDES